MFLLSSASERGGEKKGKLQIEGKREGLPTFKRRGRGFIPLHGGRGKESWGKKGGKPSIIPTQQKRGDELSYHQREERGGEGKDSIGGKGGGKEKISSQPPPSPEKGGGESHCRIFYLPPEEGKEKRSGEKGKGKGEDLSPDSQTK